MSVPNFEGTTTDPDLLDAVDPTFSAVFEALGVETDAAPAEPGTEPPAADAAPAGRAAPAGEGAGGAGAKPDVADAGGAGKPGVEGEGGAAPAGEPGSAGPAAGAVAHETIKADFGKISTALEENTLKLHKEAALEEVRTEYGRYFDALQMHPRALVGQEVPSMTGEGMEILRDSADAKDWQDAVKQVLVDEIKDRAGRLLENDRGTLETLHSSIELFQNNPDLVPGTKEFDPELAKELVQLVQPYEVRNSAGKLIGYSVPVQPLVGQLRTKLAASRAAAQAAPAPSAQAPAGKAQAAPGSTSKAAPAPAPVAPADGPQAGISSKAGASADDAEDFSVLFGTLGLPDFRI